jgi:hypothetical protein
MGILTVFFGFFALMSLVALVRFEGNALFVFSLLLSIASIAWIVQQDRAPAGPKRRPRKTRRRS